VTGGAGFIGSHLVDALLAQGDTVAVLDSFSTGVEENLRQHANDLRLKVVRGSVLDEPLVDELVSESQLVFHLAAAVGVHHVLSEPLQAMTINIHGTENVLAAAQRHEARVVLASSSEIYGLSQDVPFREGGPRVLGPTWVHRWSYATAKAIDEHLGFAYADRGLQVSVVRYFNVYGPRIDETGYGSVIARFASQALRGTSLTVHGDGKQTRCFTFVSDAVRGTLLAGQRQEALGRAFNIGTDVETSIWDLAHRIRDSLGSASEIVLVPYTVHYPRGFADAPRRRPDTSRARELLEFVAEVSLERGLGATLAWCRSHYVDRPLPT
jgi:UDP-glucose 4-epimerase